MKMTIAKVIKVYNECKDKCACSVKLNNLKSIVLILTQFGWHDLCIGRFVTDFDRRVFTEKIYIAHL
ncbi:hypothetical protein GCM10028804_45700 [Larkinella terrae]